MDDLDKQYILDLEETIKSLRKTIKNQEATIASMTAAGAMQKIIGDKVESYEWTGSGYRIISEVMPLIDPEWKPDLYKKGNE